MPTPTPLPAATDPEVLLQEINRKIFNNKKPASTPQYSGGREKTDRELAIFIQKVSMMAIVNMMNRQIEPSAALAIVDDAFRAHRSVYDLYMEKKGKGLSWFRKIAVAFNYFLYFHLGIIPNTLDIFIKTFLDKTRRELVQKDGGSHLTALIDKALTEASSFLDLYLKAVEDYANGENLKGSRDEHISQELSRKPEISQEQICRQFAITAVREFLPRVPFFLTLKNSSWRPIRRLGFFCDAVIGRGFNLILRKGIEKTIPSVIQSMVKQSIKAADPDKLPFAVSITRGIVEQLQKFKNTIESPNYMPPSAITQVPGAQKLPEIIKKLTEALRLEPLKTRTELREHFHKKPLFSNPVKWEINRQIEESMIIGCSESLSYLSDPENSEEIFYRMLNLSNATFASGTAPTVTEYELLKEQMLFEAREVFQIVIRKSIKNHIQGPSDAQVEKMALDIETEERIHLNETVERMRQTVRAMRQRLETACDSTRSQVRPSVIDGLDSMNVALEKYQTLAMINLARLIPSSIRRGVDKIMIPVYQDVSCLLDHIGRAKSLLVEPSDDFAAQTQGLSICLNDMDLLIEKLSQKAKDLRVRKVESLPQKIVGALGGLSATAGMAAGALFGWGLSYFAPVSTYLCGAAKRLQIPQRALALIPKNNTAVRTITKAAAYGLPCIGASIPILLCAAGGKRIGKMTVGDSVASFISNNHLVIDQIMAVFKNAYKFILKPPVWRWAVNDSLKCVSSAYNDE